jgi:histidine kinase
VVEVKALLEASQAIAAEIHLDKLVQVLLTAMQHSAGASRAALFLKENNELRKVADTAEGEGNFARTVVQYVLRSKEPVVLGNAQQSKEFPDGYLPAAGIKSLLTAPILYQGAMMGLVYLENDVTTQAFLPRHLELVAILAGQAAAGLRNAMMYGDLEQLVAQRTDALKKAHQRVVDVERSQTEMQMAGGFAHEIRNALAPVAMVMDLDAGEQPGAAMSDDVIKMVNGGVKRALMVTDQILTYAETARLVVKDEWISLDGVVSDVLKNLKERDGIVVHVDIEPQLRLPLQAVHATQIMHILLSNSLDALGGPHGRPKALHLKAYSDGSAATVTVHDTGVGIPPLAQGQIFRPFFSTKGAQGMGMGLALARKLVNAYGGDLTFQSNAQDGTTFSLAVPLKS